MRRKLALVAAVVLACCSAGQASAAPPDFLPPLLQGIDYDGASWAVFDLAIPAGAQGHVGLEYTGTGYENVAFIQLVKDGQLQFGFLTSGACANPGDHDVLVEAAPVGYVVDDLSRTCTGGGGGMWLGVTAAEAVNLRFVVMTTGVGGTQSGQFHALGTEGVSVAGSSSGSGVVYRTDRDFSGTLNAKADSGTLAGGAQVAVQESTSAVVDHSLYGWFLSNGFAGYQQQSWTGPGKGSSCDYGTLFTGCPAGDFTFTVDAKAMGGPLFASDIKLIAADVVLPGGDGR